MCNMVVLIKYTHIFVLFRILKIFSDLFLYFYSLILENVGLIVVFKYISNLGFIYFIIKKICSITKTTIIKLDSNVFKKVVQKISFVLAYLFFCVYR